MKSNNRLISHECNTLRSFYMRGKDIFSIYYEVNLIYLLNLIYLDT